MVKNLQTKMIMKDSDIKNEIDFELYNELIYHKNRRKFCISSNIE